MKKHLMTIAVFAVASGMAFSAAAADNAKMIDKVAKAAGISKAQATKALNSIPAYLQESLAKGNSVEWSGIGTFSRKKTKEVASVIPARFFVEFKTDRAFNDALN